MERSAANPKGKADASRTTATFWGLITEIGFGGVLGIWIVDPESTDRVPFGRVASIVTMIVAIGIILIGILVVRLSHEKSRTVRRGTAYSAFAIATVVGYLGVTSIFVDSNGPWVLLVTGAAGTFIVARHLSPTKVQAGPGEGTEI